ANVEESVAPDFAEHVLGDVDRHFRGDSQRDRVARPAVDLDQLAFMSNAEFREIGMLAEVVDINVLQLAAHALDDAGDKVIGGRPRVGDAFDATVDAGRLEDADDDREAAVAVDFLEGDDLLLVDLTNDDPPQLHLDRHERLPCETVRRPWIIRRRAKDGQGRPAPGRTAPIGLITPIGPMCRPTPFSWAILAFRGRCVTME